jgi:signal transduction histidine kinase
VSALFAGAALLVAALAALRAGTERRHRRDAQQRAATLRAQLLEAEHALRDSDARDRAWLAVLAHEMRSPVAAIVGYGELLTDGMFGPLSERGTDAVIRMNQAAAQILQLTEGVELIAADGVDDLDPPTAVSSLELLAVAADALRFDAEARGSALSVSGGDVHIRTRPDEAQRTLVLAIGAAVKVTTDSTIALRAVDHATAVRFVISGSRLDTEADEPARDGQRLTGAGFRIVLARTAAALIDGSVTLAHSADGTELLVDLPHLSD